MIRKIVLWILLFLLPLHAFIVTVLKCKFAIDTDILRFWKEWIILILLLMTFFTQYKKYDWSLKKLYHKNTLLGLTTAFIVCSALYLYFPFFELKAASVLWFRYDVFFLFALLIGLYLPAWEEDIRFYMKMVFLSTFWILIVFLPWYLFWDIKSTVWLFGYSNEASTYTANACLSFAQNVEGWYAWFQATFGGPIRMSVYLTLVGSLFMGYILSATRFTRTQKYTFIAIFWTLILTSIFFSYSKTSILWAIFAIALFSFLTFRYIYRRVITRKMYIQAGIALSLPIILVIILKWDMFLHLWSVLNRLENLGRSAEMFFYNPMWYGLGIAGPASQIGNSIESAWGTFIATSNVLTIHRFLPENWYVQILLEQWIIGLSIFVSLIIFIGYRLVSRIKQHRDFVSVWVATAYFSLCFMALFTHAFEEAASSYMLFFFIGILLHEGMMMERHSKK